MLPRWGAAPRQRGGCWRGWARVTCARVGSPNPPLAGGGGVPWGPVGSPHCRDGVPGAAGRLRQQTPPPHAHWREGGAGSTPPPPPHGTRAAPRGAAAEPVFSAPAVAVGMAACTTYPIVHGPHPPPPARAICALPSLDRPRPSAPLPPSHHPRSLPPQASPPSPPSPAIPPLSCHPPWPLRLYLPAAFLLPRPPAMASEAAHRR